MKKASPSESNQLLARLPARERARLVEACVEVDLDFEQTLLEAGNAIAHVYFPLGGFLSLLRPIDGQQIEVALAGREGMFGWALTLGSHVSDVKVLVQGSGSALRMSSRVFQRELGASEPLRKTIARYTYVLMTQFAQTAGCNRFHVVEQRLARWLLMTGDRARSDTFRVTQEFLANMLGVRRAGVTQAAGQLADRGLIRYSRGDLEIRNRSGLENAACSCYRINNDTYKRMMG